MNTMSALPDQVGEHLSALMDGELGRDQVRFLLRRVESESDLTRRWSNYQLISTTLKREFVVVSLPVDFADNVMRRLDTEAGIVADASNLGRGLGALRWIGGGAIAAAVAVVALVVSRPVGQDGGPAGIAAPSVAVVQTAPAVSKPHQSYLPPLAQPILANPLPMSGFAPNNLMQASYDTVLPNYYAMQGQQPAHNGSPVAGIPYVLRAFPVAQHPEAASAQDGGSASK